MVLASLSYYASVLHWPEAYLRHFDGVVLPARNLTAPPVLPPHHGPVYLRIGGPQGLDLEERAVLEVTMARYPIAALIALRPPPGRIRQRFPHIPHWHLVTSGRVPPRAAHVVLARPDAHPNVRAYQLPANLDAYQLQRMAYLDLLARFKAIAIVPISTLHPEHAILIADDVRNTLSAVEPPTPPSGL